MIDWSKYEIDISKARSGKTLCPKCSHTRKHKSDPCLSIDLKTGLFNCHNCGFKGTAANNFEKKVYEKPPSRLEKLSEKTIAWFEKERHISNNTLLRFNITEAKEWMPQAGKEMNAICFNYLRNNELVNIKFRDAAKGFKLSKGAELIFYNIDSLKGEKSAVIVEGEIDCLSMYEAGIFNCVSVPNGASKGSQKLEYLDNCWQYFEGIDKIIIAVDNDEAGQSLQDEIARRFGKEICWKVQYPDDCKDSNEVLIKHGKSSLAAIVNNAIQYPLEGVVSVDQMREKLIGYYENGYPKGCAAGIDGFDELLTFKGGQLTMVTGIPGHGKDEFTNMVAVGLANNHDWRFGILQMEEEPEITASKVIEKYCGKAFNKRVDEGNRLTRAQLDEGMNFGQFYFNFIDTDSVNVTIPNIVEKMGQMVRRFDTNAFIISPWNRLRHEQPPGISSADYINQELSELLAFIKRTNTHLFLVAHPTKMQKDMRTGKREVPTLNSISGTKDFEAATHNGYTVYRHFDTGEVEVHVQKVKHSWMGKVGVCTFKFNTMTMQYEPIHVDGNAISKKETKLNINPNTIDYSQPKESEDDDDEAALFIQKTNKLF